jgi:HAD superfamily hydrolase (TIGR01509 family)
MVRQVMSRGGTGAGGTTAQGGVRAVVFDLDGVLIDSEQLWDRARREVAREHGGAWHEGATETMQGMSSPEWGRYLHDTLGVALPVDDIVTSVVRRVLEHLAHELPLLPGAVDAVRRVGRRWPLGLASSANRPVIDAVLERSALYACFSVTVSSEEVVRGKPAPDVYLEAARRLDVAAYQCVAIEDSANGIRSAVAAEMTVIAVPNRRFPPPGDVLRMAAVTLDGLEELTVETVTHVGRGSAGRRPTVR